MVSTEESITNATILDNSNLFSTQDELWPYELKAVF